jgi:hypothetical protein
MAIVWVLVGAFIGWTIPQPEWAKKVQALIVAKVKEVLGN